MGNNLATQLCPCGYFSDPKHECACSSQQIQKYRSKIYGPLLDRIDIHVNVPAAPYKDLMAASKMQSALIQERVAAARAIQSETDLPIWQFTATPRCPAARFKISARPMRLPTRCWNPPLTGWDFPPGPAIADFDASTDIRVDHVAEAIQYRSLDRGKMMG
jgi:magnesium chelatase family protein